MSEENVEVVRALYAAYNRGDDDTALAAFDPEVEWDARHHPDGRVYHGHDGILEFFREWNSLWESTHSEPEKLLDAGDRVVVLTLETTRAGGLEITERHGEIYTLRAGKVVHWRAFADPTAAVNAAGLPGELAHAES